MQQWYDMQTCLQTLGRGRFILVRVVYCQTSSDVDNLDVFEGVVVPSDHLLDILVDVSVHRDVMHSAANVDMNPNNYDTTVLSEDR